MFWSINEFLAFFSTLAAFMLLFDAGYRLARKQRDSNSSIDAGHFESMQTAMLGMLALLMGFTFAMAVSRFDNRKELVVEEVNAIGTSWLRLGFLPESDLGTARELMRHYVESRLEFFAAGIDQTRLAEVEAEATRIQARLWSIAARAMNAASDSKSLPLLIESMNEVFDLREKRLAALNNHVPETVLLLLFVLSILCMFLVGYGRGLQGRRELWLSTLFGLMLALVLTTILDLDRPRRGLIQVSQEAMFRLQTNLASDDSKAIPDMRPR